MCRYNINSSSPGQNGRYILANDILNCIFLNENDRFTILISLKYVPRSPIHNKPVLVQVMARRRKGDKSLSETMMTRFIYTYMRH